LSNNLEARLDTRIKLYPDGMDLTSMLYGTQEQAQEDSCYWLHCQHNLKYEKEPNTHKVIRSYYWKYLANNFVLKMKLPGMRLQSIL
jgi:hypothetical protein